MRSAARSRSAEEFPVDPVEKAHHESHGKESSRGQYHDQERLDRFSIGDQYLMSPEGPLAQKFPENAQEHEGKEEPQAHGSAADNGRQEFVPAGEHFSAGK